MIPRRGGRRRVSGANYWVDSSLVMTVAALQAGQFDELANMTEGRYSSQDLRSRLRELHAKPTPLLGRGDSVVRYLLVEDTSDEALVVATVPAHPKDIGLVLRFVRDDMDLWQTEILDLNWSDVLAAHYQGVTESVSTRATVDPDEEY